MAKENQIIKLIDTIVEETGFAVSTVCQRALNDPLAYDRLKKRDDQDRVRIAKLQAYRASAVGKNSAEVAK